MFSSERLVTVMLGIKMFKRLLINPLASEIGDCMGQTTHVIPSVVTGYHI